MKEAGKAKEAAAGPAEHDLVLSTLEPGQLAEAKKQRIPRRRLNRTELVLLWFLRIYLIFMMVVVIYQAWSAGR